MSKYKYFLFSLVTFAVFTSSVSAVTCSYEKRAELNSEVSHIEANYEVIEIELDPEDYDLPDGILGTPDEDDYVITSDALQVNILNLTENVYAEVTNSYDNETVRYDYSNTNNGNIEIVWQTLGSMASYTIEIYSSAATGCEGTLLRTLRVSLPRYNDYSTYAVCDQASDYYLCQRYVFFDEIDFGEFTDRINAEIERRQENGNGTENEDNPWYEDIGNFISEHKVPIIIGVVSVIAVAGVIVVIVVIRRRRSVI